MWQLINKETGISRKGNKDTVSRTDNKIITNPQHTAERLNLYRETCNSKKEISI
jgi:hypothetical protein